MSIPSQLPVVSLKACVISSYVSCCGQMYTSPCRLCLLYSLRPLRVYYSTIIQISRKSISYKHSVSDQLNADGKLLKNFKILVKQINLLTYYKIAVCIRFSWKRTTEKTKTSLHLQNEKRSLEAKIRQRCQFISYNYEQM